MPYCIVWVGNCSNLQFRAFSIAEWHFRTLFPTISLQCLNTKQSRYKLGCSPAVGKSRHLLLLTSVVVVKYDLLSLHLQKLPTLIMRLYLLSLFEGWQTHVLYYVWYFLLLDTDFFSLLNVSLIFISIFDHLMDNYLLSVLTLLKFYYPGLNINVSIEINQSCNMKNVKLCFKLLLTINCCWIPYNCMMEF